MIVHRRVREGEGKHRPLLICIFIMLFLTIFGEIAMRLFGFCNSPLYYNNPYTGYNLVANQNVRRFGNKFSTNEFSMRSSSLSDGEYRILLIGDSVLNGGVQTDQEKLASTMLDKKYSDEFNDVRVLNLNYSPSIGDCG